MKKRLINLIPYVMALLGIIVVWLAIANGNDVNKENNGYTRVINCIISKNAVSRSQADIEVCYLNVEQDLDIKLKRYDH